SSRILIRRPPPRGGPAAGLSSGGRLLDAQFAGGEAELLGRGVVGVGGTDPGAHGHRVHPQMHGGVLPLGRIARRGQSISGPRFGGRSGSGAWSVVGPAPSGEPPSSRPPSAGAPSAGPPSAPSAGALSAGPPSACAPSAPSVAMQGPSTPSVARSAIAA